MLWNILWNFYEKTHVRVLFSVNVNNWIIITFHLFKHVFTIFCSMANAKKRKKSCWCVIWFDCPFCAGLEIVGQIITNCKNIDSKKHEFITANYESLTVSCKIKSLGT